MKRGDGDWVVRLYRRVLGLVPGAFHPQDRDDAAALLAEMRHAAPGAPARWRVTLRAWVRLPGALARGWRERGRTGVVGRNALERRNGRWDVVDGIRQFGQSVRALLRTPVFTVTSILLVGLGVGAATAVFTVVDHVLLRALPYPAGERLVYLTNGSHSGPVVRSLSGLESLEAHAAVVRRRAGMERADGDPLRLQGAEVSTGFFGLFGARPSLGRVFVDGDGGRQDIALLTHEAWSGKFGADPEVVGRTLRLDGETVEIVGVLSPDFRSPEAVTGRTLDYLVPMDWEDPLLDNPAYFRHTLVGRLAPEVGLDALNAEMAVVAGDIIRRYPDELAERYGPDRGLPFSTLRDVTVDRAASGLRLVLAAVGLLLLVACANVAHLFLARGLERHRETAIRKALGAGRRSLLLQAAAESVIVGTAGGLLGVLLGAAGLAAFRSWIVEGLPRGTAVGLDLRVLGAAAALSLLTALVFGLLPTLRILRSSPAPGLLSGGRTSTQSRGVRLFRGSLVAGEVALSLVLVAGSALLLRSFLEMTTQAPGIRVADTWVVPVSMPRGGGGDGYVRTAEELRAALATVPGVEAVTWGVEAPFQHVGGNKCCWGTRVARPGDDAPLALMDVHPAGPGFLTTYGIPLVAGNDLPEDPEGSPLPVLVNETFAVAHFGSAREILGAELRMFPPDQQQLALRVVGVTTDTRYYGLDQPVEPALYLPARRMSFAFPGATLGLRVRDAGPGFARAVREKIWEVSPSLPLPTVVPLTEWVEASSRDRRFGALILAVFGGVALLLAAGGLYGTLLYSVQQRRRELGIRLALGADAGQVQRDVLRRGLGLAAVGASVGVVLALATGRVAESLLYGVGARDPASIGGAAALLLLTAGLASWLPARRAARTDPVKTLSVE